MDIYGKPAVLLLALLALSTVSAQDGGEVVAELAVSNVKVTVKGSDGSAISSLTGTYPKAVLANPQVPASGSLDVTFSVAKGGESFKPQQAMLMLSSKSLGLAAYAVAKYKSGAYVATINAAAVEKQIGKAPGEYDVALLAGDPSAPAGLRYDLGTAELLFAAGSAAPAPAAAVRTAGFQPLNNIKPEIVHTFRAPEKRPPSAVSLAFTALALAPLAAVLMYVPAATGVNFKAWSVAPLHALAFHASLAAMLGLYGAFWLRLNLAQTLPLAGLGGCCVAVTGYGLLSRLSASRLKRD